MKRIRINSKKKVINYLLLIRNLATSVSELFVISKM